jgi:undecaprenyl-diphosphatase
MNISGDYLLFDIMLHVGTLGAVGVYFFKDIIALFKPPFKKLGLLVLATIPAGLIGVLLGDYIDAIFMGGKYLCFFFLATAIMMFVTEFFAKKDSFNKPLTLKTAIGMGLMQAVGVLPGISRSGSTIFGGVMTKTERSEVASFSFLMSIPVILGSAAVETYHVIKEGVTVDFLPLVVGVVVAFISGYLAITLVMKLVKKANFKWFGVYLIALSFITFFWLFL